MKVSVFGATGFIGSWFCRESQHETVAVPREERKPPTGDVLYLISTTHNYHVFDDPHRDIYTNLAVLVDVLEAWRKAGRKGVFNYVSTWFVYGDVPLPAREDAHCQPRGFYGITKLAAEQFVRSYCDTYGLPWRILRPGNIYGPGDKPTKQKNALQWLIGKLRANEPVELYHGGDVHRDYLHVRDAVRAFDIILDKARPFTTFNVGSGERYHFGDLIRLAARFLRSRSKIESIEPPVFHQQVQVRDFWLDITPLRRLGFERSISIGEGIEELCR